MAKTMTLDEEQFRAVILHTFPGLTYPKPLRYNSAYPLPALPELKTYHAAGGTDYEYHRVSVCGPFSTTGQARAQITRAKKDAIRSYGTDQYVEAFVEVAETIWKKII